MLAVLGLLFVFLVCAFFLLRRPGVLKLVEERLSKIACDVRERRCLALINPVSGRQTGRQDWACMSAALQKRGFRCTALHTERRGHLNEILEPMMTIKEDYDDLAIAGGDGFLCEFFNASRDVGVTLLPPVVTVPCGTGNGVATSLGIRSIADAAAAMYCGEEKAMDLMSVELGSRTPRLSVLSVGWGGIADADFLMEQDLRWLGPMRTLVVPLMIIARLRSYPGKLRFKAARQQGAIHKPHSVDKEGRIVLEGNFILAHLCNLPWMATDMWLAPGSRIDDGSIAIVVIRNCTRLQLVRMFLNAESGDHVNLDFVELYWATEVTLEPEQTVVGSIAVDGEAMGYPEKVVVKSLPGATRVRVPRM